VTTAVGTDTELDEFVRLGVAGVSLHWRVGLPRDLEYAQRILGMTPIAHTAALVADFEEHVTGFELAREYSFCLYATLPYWRHQTIRAGQQAIATGKYLDQVPDNYVQPDEARNVTSLLMAAGLLHDADEVSWWGHRKDGNGPIGDVYRSSVYGQGEDDKPEPPPAGVRPYQVRLWWD